MRETTVGEDILNQANARTQLAGKFGLVSQGYDKWERKFLPKIAGSGVRTAARALISSLISESSLSQCVNQL
jgi:hypothetical protein